MIARRALGTIATATATSLPITIPAGIANGDVMVLAIAVQTAVGQVFGGLTGWTQVQNVDPVNANVLAVFVKTCNGDAGATVTPTWQTNALAKGIVSGYLGVDTSSPVYASAVGVEANTTAEDFGAAVAGLNCMAIVANVNSAASILTATGYTGATHTTTYGFGYGDKLITDAGLNEDPAVTLGTGGFTYGILILLRPAAVPEFRDVGASTSAAAAVTVSPSSNANTQIGDLLVAQVEALVTTAVWNTPAGWLLAGQANGVATFYKFATAAGAQAQAFTISTAATDLTAHIAAYAGVGSVEAVASSAFAASAAPTAPSVTPAGVGRRLVLAGGAAGAAPTGTPPTGQVERLDAGVGKRAYLSDESTGGTLATGTRTLTWSVAATGNLVSLLLAPPARGIPALRGIRLGDIASSVTWPVILPPGVVDGDTLIVELSTGITDPGAVTTPAGWTLVEDQGAAARGMKVFMKTAAGEGATATFTLTNAAAGTFVAIALAGRSILDVDASVTAQTLPDLSLARPGVIIYTYSRASTAINSPDADAGTTILTTGTGLNNVIQVWLEVHNAAGSSGARAFSESSSQSDIIWAGALYSLAGQSHQMLI